MSEERDLEMRRAAFDHVRGLSQMFGDVIPLEVLRQGFRFNGERVSLGSFMSGIYRPRQMRGPAALALVTAPPKGSGAAPYNDEYDERTGAIVYHYRTARSATPAAQRQAESDNRWLRAAYELNVPLIYFHGVAPGFYSPVFPIFVTADHPARRVVTLEAGLPVTDVSDRGLQSGVEMRRYATREARFRLHQHRFRVDVLSAYKATCAVCELREPMLVQAAHIIGDSLADGEAIVPNGIALCAMHHLAYDRNVIGIDPAGVVHVAARFLNQVGGPMLHYGLQAFHGHRITVPRRVADRPDRMRLEQRFVQYMLVA